MTITQGVTIGIISRIAGQDIIPKPADDDVVSNCPIQRIILIRAIDRLILTIDCRRNCGLRGTPLTIRDRMSSPLVQYQ